MNAPYRSVWTELLATPFRQGWIDAGGIRTRYVQAGDESHPPLVMLHGTAGSLENFAANIAAHAEHFNVIALDMIGSGMTGKPDYDYETGHYVQHLNDFYAAMGLEKASVIGLSLGARVASRFAIDHPQAVDKLILLSATAYFPARPIQGDIKKSRTDAAANPTWDSVREIFKGLFHDETKVWDDMIATRLALYSRPEMKQAMSSHPGAARSCGLRPQPYPRRRLEEADRADHGGRRGRSCRCLPRHRPRDRQADPERQRCRDEELQPLAADGSAGRIQPAEPGIFAAQVIGRLRVSRFCETGAINDR